MNEHDELKAQLSYEGNKVYGAPHVNQLHCDAADAIESLQRRVGELEAARERREEIDAFATRLHRGLNGLDRDSTHERVTVFFEAFADGMIIGDGNREGTIARFCDFLDEERNRERERCASKADDYPGVIGHAISVAIRSDREDGHE